MFILIVFLFIQNLILYILFFLLIYLKKILKKYGINKN